MRYILISVALYIFIFITGISGLVYQVAWQKYLGRLLGSDSIATAIILAAFLGGLSLGYYLCGKITTRVKNHLKAYAILEGIIGAWCLNFPIIFKSVESFTQYWSFSPPLLIIVQGFFCSALLMGIPTVAMGGTIPFLTRGISKNVEEATHIHARVYSVNTAGAFLGTLLAGFYLIPEFGLPLTVMGAAFLNISACVFFYILPAVLQTTGDDTEPHLPGSDLQTPPRFQPWVLCVIAFLSGFYVMTLENVLIRITSFSLGSSSYTFSLIVSVFILSIAIGSYAVDRLKNISAGLLFANQLVITLSLVLVYISLDTWPYWAHVIRIFFQPNIAGMFGYYINIFLILLLVLIIPVGFMGATVPITFHEIKRDLKNVGKHSGILFSLNTVGSLSGSLIGGIVFYYFMDNAGVFLTAAFLASVSTCLAAWQLPKGRVAAFVSLAILILALLTTPFYQKINFMKGTFRFRRAFSFSLKGPDVFFQEINKQQELKFYNDGPAATVSVVEYPRIQRFDEKPLSIMINGKADSSTIGDTATLKLLAHIPALLAEKRNNIMVVGLGTGVTAGELTLYPDADCIDVAEISPSVIEALPYFHKFTNNVHENQKVVIHKGDAFRILGRSRKKWDIITSEPSNPWVSGVDLLFTQEFYKLAREHLTENGILVQWIHVYYASPAMVGMIVNTIQQEFKEAHVFMVNGADLLLVASQSDFSLKDIERAENTLNSNEQVRSSLKTVNIESFEAILIREIWSPLYMLYNFSDYGKQTMDNPRLHYEAGKNFFTGGTITADFLLNPDSAYFNDYLIKKKYENWNGFPFSNITYNRFMLSSKEVISDSYLHMAASVRLKTYITGSDACQLTDKEKKAFSTDLIPFIKDFPEDEKDWEKINLKGASFRKKSEALINHIFKYRNWIAAYPVDGLKQLLLKGMSDGKDEYEKNWCLLQMASLLLMERTDINKVTNMLKQISRDADGKIIVKNQDKVILKTIYQKMEKLKTIQKGIKQKS
ncbi:MAG: hypothetical protein GY795_09110 [Desulfobacterales bacterium]|nr:hypothetical protein [Desulfobacterales bacterium]